MSTENKISITELGNPAKPQGEAGEMMLKRMGESHSGVTAWAFGKLDIKGSERVLDIGCGGGDALKRMSANITTGTLTGVDYSEVSVELSRKNNSEDIINGKMHIEEGSVEALPFDNDSFELIYTVESFYFWGNDMKNLREVRRVLSENGTFMIVADIHGAADLSEDAVKNIKKYALFNPTPEEYKELLETAGFKNVQVYTSDENSFICVKAHK